MTKHEQNALHLSSRPDSPDRFPECLRSEVERVAQEIHDHHLIVSDPADPLQEWLEAEDEVLGRYVESPARRLPGGDLFNELV